METGRQALVFFYALFWAVALSVTGRYQAFDTPSICSQDRPARRRALNRLLVSLIVLNLLPALLLIVLYQYIIPNRSGWGPIVAAPVASLSVFGFHRILHAIIASEPTYHRFYTKDELCDVRDRGKFSQPQTFRAHFCPGVFYIIFFSVLARLILLLS